MCRSGRRRRCGRARGRRCGRPPSSATAAPSRSTTPDDLVSGRDPRRGAAGGRPRPDGGPCGTPRRHAPGRGPGPVQARGPPSRPGPGDRRRRARARRPPMRPCVAIAASVRARVRRRVARAVRLRPPGRRPAWAGMTMLVLAGPVGLSEHDGGRVTPSSRLGFGRSWRVCAALGLEGEVVYPALAWRPSTSWRGCTRRSTWTSSRRSANRGWQHRPRHLCPAGLVDGGLRAAGAGLGR